MGRPSKLTPAVLQTITDRLSKGEPLAVICRDEGMPSDRTVREWVETNKEVSSAIARAREAGEEAIAADCLLIADDSTGDYRMGEKGLLVDTDHIQRAKLRIDTRLKLLAKWNPRKWGDGLTVRGDKDNPVQTETRYTLTDAELQAIAARARGDAAE